MTTLAEPVENTQRADQILTFVKARFGTVPEAVRSLLEQADGPALDRLTHKIARADSLADILTEQRRGERA